MNKGLIVSKPRVHWLRWLSVHVLLLAGLLGCSTSNYTPPSLVLPVGWTGGDRSAGRSTAGAVSLPGRAWWTQFSDEHLLQLLEQAALNNPDIALAAKNVIAAQLAIQEVESARLPTPSLSISSNAGNVPGTSSIAVNHSLSLGLTYGVDLWGKLATELKIQQNNLAISEFQAAQVQLAQQIAVATTYWQMAVLSAQIRLLEQQSRNLQKLLDLSQARYQQGLVILNDVDQIRESLLAIGHQMLITQHDISVAQNVLAILLGSPPTGGGEVVAPLQRDAPVPSVEPPLLPAELLLRRVDLREAAVKLENAALAVRQGNLNHLPQPSIGFSSGKSALSLASLLSAPTSFGLGLGLSQPWVNYLQNARTRSALDNNLRSEEIRFRKSVYAALAEVDNALLLRRKFLASEQRTQESLRYQDRQVAYAQARYDVGLTDVGPLLQALNARLQLESGAVSARLGLLTNLLDLYRALGGPPWAPAANG